MNVVGLEKKEFVITIEWVLDADTLVSEGTESALDYLREIGSADITDIQFRDKVGT